MSRMIPASPSGTLILYDDEGDVVQYSLENIQAEFQSELYSSVRLELSARMGGENFVNLSNRRDDIFRLLLELYAEQCKLGASEDALAITRDRIERHVKEEAA